jgi:hypothetical protein
MQFAFAEIGGFGMENSEGDLTRDLLQQSY